MANALGYITETDTGFEGTLSMLTLSTPIRIVANGLKQDGTRQPDYRVLAGGAGCCDLAGASGEWAPGLADCLDAIFCAASYDGLVQQKLHIWR